MDLLPGCYWAELEFDRPADEATVLGALRDMGFVEASLEHKDAPPGYTGRVRSPAYVGGVYADQLRASAPITASSASVAMRPSIAQTTATPTPNVAAKPSSTPSSPSAPSAQAQPPAYGSSAPPPPPMKGIVDPNKSPEQAAAPFVPKTPEGRDQLIGPAERVIMEQRGIAAIAADPPLGIAAASFGGFDLRGFRIAIGVLSTGEYTPAGMRRTLGPDHLKGYDAAVNAWTNTPSSSPATAAYLPSSNQGPIVDEPSPWSAPHDPYIQTGPYEIPNAGYGQDIEPPAYTAASLSKNEGRATVTPSPSAPPRIDPPSIVASAAPPPECSPVGPGMFVCSPPRNVKIGRAAARSVWRFPFLARLDRPITLRDAPGMRWSRVHELPLDPFAPMTFRIIPWTLDEGVVYGLRFMSRDRSVRGKEDVAQILVQMGFDPVSLLLAKRNVRIPGRTASCSEWIGFGRWTGPATVVTTDDPFYFADARPVPAM